MLICYFLLSFYSNKTGTRTYVLKSKQEAKQMLFFRDFNFSRVSTNAAGRKRRVSWIWYSDEQIERDGLEIREIRAFSRTPIQVRANVQPTVIYDESKKRLQFKFDMKTEDVEANDAE
jgi:hypothetical protein